MLLVNGNCKHSAQQSNSKKIFYYTQFIELTLYSDWYEIIMTHCTKNVLCDFILSRTASTNLELDYIKMISQLFPKLTVLKKKKQIVLN